MSKRVELKPVFDNTAHRCEIIGGGFNTTLGRGTHLGIDDRQVSRQQALVVIKDEEIIITAVRVT